MLRGNTFSLIGRRDINLLTLPFIPQSVFKHLICAGYNWEDPEITDTQALFLGSSQATRRKDTHGLSRYTEESRGRRTDFLGGCWGWGIGRQVALREGFVRKWHPTCAQKISQNLQCWSQSPHPCSIPHSVPDCTPSPWYSVIVRMI